MRSALFLSLLLAGCPEPTCAEGGDCADSDGAWGPVALMIETGLTPDSATNGLALAFSREDPGEGFLSVYSDLKLTNRSADADCVVAVYVDEDPPDPEALFVPDAQVYPPETVEGLGQLVDADNIPHLWDEQATVFEARWEEEQRSPEEERDPVEGYLSVVTCASPDLSVTAYLNGWYREVMASNIYDDPWDFEQIW